MMIRFEVQTKIINPKLQVAIHDVDGVLEAAIVFD
jgi:hypothetical protein